MLNVNNVSVHLRRKQILHNISFTAEPGTVTAIVGPNGSGKSTLLKATTGELGYDGDITLDGLDVSKAKAWQLSSIRAVLPQATPLSFPFQVIEVVRLGLSEGTVGQGEDTLALAALDRVGLGGYANRFYQELSGGEQQRCQLARVLCQAGWGAGRDVTGRWLFLDEPVASLDIAHQLQVMQIARDFADQGGGVLVVMHDLNLSAMFADRILVIREGHLAADGPADQTLSDGLLSEVYGCPIRTSQAPASGQWFFLPHAAG